MKHPRLARLARLGQGLALLYGGLFVGSLVFPPVPGGGWAWYGVDQARRAAALPAGDAARELVFEELGGLAPVAGGPPRPSQVLVRAEKKVPPSGVYTPAHR